MNFLNKINTKTNISERTIFKINLRKERIRKIIDKKKGSIINMTDNISQGQGQLKLCDEIYNYLMYNDLIHKYNQMRSMYFTVTDSNPITINTTKQNISDLIIKDNDSLFIKDMSIIYNLPISSLNSSETEVLISESFKDSLLKLILSHFKGNTNISISIYKLIELSNEYIEYRKHILSKETCINHMNHMNYKEIYRKILILYSFLLLFLCFSNSTHEKTVQSEQILNGIYLFSSIDNEDFNEDDYIIRNISSNMYSYRICKEITSIFSDSLYVLFKKTVKNIVFTKGTSQNTDDYINIISYIFLIMSNCIIDDTFNIKIMFSIEKFMVFTEKLTVFYEFLGKSGGFLYNSLVFESFLENLTFFHLQIERNLSIFDENEVDDGYYFSLINMYSLVFKILYIYSDRIRNYNENSQISHKRNDQFTDRNNEKISNNTDKSTFNTMESSSNLLSKIKIITNYYTELFNNKLFSIILFDFKLIYKTLINILYSFLLINNSNQQTTTDLLMIFKLINTILFSYKPDNLVLFSKNPLSFFSSSHEIYKKEGNLICDEIQIQFFIRKDLDLLLVQISNSIINYLGMTLVKNKEESVGEYDESYKESVFIMGVESYLQFNFLFSKYYVIYEKVNHSLYLQSIIDLYNSLNTVNHIKNMVFLLEILENLVKNNKNPGLSTLFRCDFLLFPSKIKYLSVNSCFQKKFCLSWIRLCLICLVKTKKTQNFYGFSDFFVGSDFFLIVKELSNEKFSSESDDFHEIYLYAKRILSLLENEFGFCVDED